MSDRFINSSSVSAEIFFSGIPLWDIQVNGYPVLMILWNLALAIVALLLAYRFVSLGTDTKRTPLALAVTAFLWLVFLPNTAYMITDIRHIIGYCPAEEYGNVCAENAWMSVFFFAYAVAGWISFVLAVRPVRSMMDRRFGARRANVFFYVLMPLVSLGVLLGLVNRWNSWEIFTDPFLILGTLTRYVTDVVYLKNWILLTILLFGLYFLGERLFNRLPWERK